MDYPVSAAEIIVALNEVEDQIHTIVTGGIEAFARLAAGSIEVSPKDYLEALYKRRDQLQEQLKTSAYWVDHDLEGTI